jgi:PPOX class probable F420-dependent enzyme
VPQPDGSTPAVPVPGDPKADGPTPAERAPEATGDQFASLAAEPFLSLVTFRRDGTAVPTPIWAVAGDGRLLVWTGAESGKVKRLRHTPAVTVAPCDRGGALLGEPVPAHARVMPVDELITVATAMRAKYGWQFRVATVAAAIGKVIGISGPGQIGLEIVLD